ncbi:hypothetical protein DL96DRAFT_1605848 [Flagelloscypha sp. PMI_526]|nr:hypothetical protein DL96DRAFT_1605848 [Flagelloscypha sp. PMI_526]
MPSLKETYASQGYVVVPNLISPSQFPELVSACDRVIAKTRSGQWPHRRTMGRMFPPYDADSPDSWGVQHIMNPELKEPVFANWYTSDALVDVAKELLGCVESDLQMELFNLLINPVSQRFALCWHRDDIKATATEEEEVAALGIWHHGVQWNTALYEDSCLFIVPGTHSRPRTEAQRKLSADSTPPKDPLDMPGAIQLTLKVGETVFYNNNILHCATYSPDSKRATLHACIGDTRGGSTRSRNILQHGLRWMRDPVFKDTLTDRGKKMLEHLLQMEKASNGQVEYSLEG